MGCLGCLLRGFQHSTCLFKVVLFCTCSYQKIHRLVDDLMRPQGFLAFPSWLLSLVLSHQIYPLTGDNPSRAQLTTNFYIDCGHSLRRKVRQDLPRIEVLKEFHYQQKCPLRANVAICRELVGEETSAAMSFNVWICILLMLRFVHFRC